MVSGLDSRARDEVGLMLDADTLELQEMSDPAPEGVLVNHPVSARGQSAVRHGVIAG
jgi:hypothetical protein